VRKVGGAEVFSLQNPPNGIFSIPREWTDKAQPDPYEILENGPPILSCSCLLQLISLVSSLNKKETRTEKKELIDEKR
jgi:hypothetical protein